MNSSRKLGFLIGTIVIFVALILIGPMDFFTHGAYGDPINISNLTEEDYLGTVPLSQEEEYSIYFTPQQNYFTGFWIYPDLQSSSGDGFICIKTYLQSGTQMEQIQIPVSDISSSGYYYVETSARYLAGETYKVAFSVKDTLNAPSFYLVSSAYIPVESTQSNLLIGYLYAAPVFSLAEKAIIFLVLLSIWFFLLATLWFGENTKARSHQARIVSAFLAIVSVFTMNYMFAVFYSDDTAATFSSSDTLVLSVLDAPAHHLQQNAFGLGDLTSGRGTYFSNGRDANYPNDSNWAYGYSKTKPIIALSKNSYTEQFAREGTTVLFANGTSHTVNEVVDNGSYYMMVLSATAPLSYEEYGSLDLATYYTADGTEFQAYFLSPYKAQFGLQGKIFFLLSTLLPQGDMETAFNLLCSGAMAGVLSVLIFLIRHRYGLMMAVCFGGTFLLSPWIGAAASSLYWVSFTWFLPMIIGLICAIWIENKAVCIGMIALGYASILIKSLCGYEYITTVMLGLISFLLVDFLLALIRRDRVHSVLLFRTIFLMGVFALLGFLTAILIHAYVRGNGNILEGITAICYNDVLRRSTGGSINIFAPAYWPSFNASIWDVLKLYFTFRTDVITGLDAKLFPVVCLLPIVIFLYDYYKKQLNVELILLYLVFFVTAISWIVLAKSHSYIHTTINYVVFYFGYIQVCFYIIIQRVRSILCHSQSTIPHHHHQM